MKISNTGRQMTAEVGFERCFKNHFKVWFDTAETQASTGRVTGRYFKL